jgi:DNA repair protein RecO (recombination protein O)
MSRIDMQPAFILHGRAFRESSQLLEVYSRDFGRLGVVARGARRPKSRWQNMLQPFRPLLLSWSRRGDLGTLTGAEQVAAPPPLQGESLYCGLYVNELLMRLLHRDDPHPEVFEKYRETLAGLSQGGEIQPLLRVFEKHLLDATGFGLILDHETPGQEPLQADALYEYRPGQGPVRVSEQGRGQGGVVSGSALRSLQSEQLVSDDLPALRKMMRRVIRYHLGDKPLASESLYLKTGAAPRELTNGELSE